MTREIKFALWHPVYGFLNTMKHEKSTYTQELPETLFDTEQDALNNIRFPLRIVTVLVETFSCNHPRRMAYSIHRGRNAGKWIAVCVDCGEKSVGRPKSTERIAHEALVRRPCVNKRRLARIDIDER